MIKKQIKNELLRNTIKNKGILFLALPGLLLLLAFNYLPMLGIIIPFKKIDYAKGILRSDWAGFDNFKFLFSGSNIIRATYNTLIQNALFIVITLVVSFSFALILYDLSSRKVKLYQTAFFIPFFLSWVVVSYVVYAFLNPDLGIINQILKIFGVNEAINWYGEPQCWRVILVICYLWKYTGYYTILYYTSLIGIDSTYYEASSIDGATRRQQIWSISIPLVLPVMIMLVLLQIGKIFFSDFGLFYFIPKNTGVLFPTTDVIDTFVFRSLQNDPNLGMTAAAGLFQTVAGFILVMAANKLTKKLNSDLALF